MVDQLCELGFYSLAGHSSSPRDLIAEVADAERIGLGSAFISERFNLKDAATLSGAVGAVSTTLGIATAATNHNTRHPIITATMATTMHRFTDGRFCLGLGRGFDPLFDVMGIPRVTMAQLEDFAGIMRQLWHGQLVLGHEGPAGNYPLLNQDATFDEDIPILLVALGPKTLEFAGKVADAVVLHTFFTDEALANSVAAVRKGAEQAGRDPASIRVWSVLATVGDHIDDELQLKKLTGRLATYLQGYGDILVKVNGWDPQVLTDFRQHEIVTSATGALDQTATREQLEELTEFLPDAWLEVAARGTADQCAAKVLEQFDVGADGVILHGATPLELEPVVDAYRRVRPDGRFDDAVANPGWGRR